MDVLVDSLIAKVNELRSKPTPPDDGQGEQAADAGAARVLQLISNLSEADLQGMAAGLASPLRNRAADMKRELAARGPGSAAMCETTDVTGSKFADLPEAAYGTREDFFSGLERVGVPHPRASEEMRTEFAKGADATDLFKSWNSGEIETTPEKELAFVEEPFKPETVREVRETC